MSVERFERLAAQFYRDTGYIAPGKDVPAAMASDSYNTERAAAWDAWKNASDAEWSALMASLNEPEAEA